ncbi:tRNA (adenosine(37)-N6)-threonylcarbamoyltransferase complex dimerization subunit type 1 TsaB [Pandoraea thiooxydans]|uniref:tRNA threonylcarbamoyladenosine biosynthesis protein TsaB n=1 Tax=Pandoraea thiooxydans TaxID=445709 RepID=A0A0G3EQC7_9BURK|nr:tRNA (adenosine(37)-N6)-threonylcarbamoyltransferase complex dimerization subunit type 1 TsaB [Pandoraea thiooxydans]AKJ68239.1 tRNA (adenosine(37)-N6)-threonylcarbamoyltransferase complex dimerization subunit type 1 TsaB [Pandoraea thiooxydans]
MSAISILALDTSTEFCSVALYLNSLGTERAIFRHRHTGAVSSTHILPLIREVLDEAGLALGACNAIAFGAGPGSFTGLRTACGVAQGLAYGAGLPVIPVGTLLACAEMTRAPDAAPDRVVVALDARMDEVYWADYSWDKPSRSWVVNHDAALDAPDALPRPDEPFSLAGNAAAIFGDRLPLAGQAAAVLSDALPHASAVAALAARDYALGRTLPAHEAAPFYIRNKVAQTVAERQAAAGNRATLAHLAEGR